MSCGCLSRCFNRIFGPSRVKREKPLSKEALAKEAANLATRQKILKQQTGVLQMIQAGNRFVEDNDAAIEMLEDQIEKLQKSSEEITDAVEKLSELDISTSVALKSNANEIYKYSQIIDTAVRVRRGTLRLDEEEKSDLPRAFYTSSSSSGRPHHFPDSEAAPTYRREPSLSTRRYAEPARKGLSTFEARRDAVLGDLEELAVVEMAGLKIPNIDWTKLPQEKKSEKIDAIISKYVESQEEGQRIARWLVENHSHMF